jgi:hypothetical protein
MDGAVCEHCVGSVWSPFTLREADGGTDVLAVHDNVPPGVAPMIRLDTSAL